MTNNDQLNKFITSLKLILIGMIRNLIKEMVQKIYLSKHVDNHYCYLYTYDKY